MKKYLIILLIVFLGIIFNYFRVNIYSGTLPILFENSNSYLILLLLPLILFLLVVFIFNLKYEEFEGVLKEADLKTDKQDVLSQSKNTISAYFKKAQEYDVQNQGRVKYYLFSFLLAVLIGVYFGFRFKKLGSYLLLLTKMETQWETELEIQLLRTQYSFFKLKIYNTEGASFLFNWEAFFLVIVIVLGLFLIIKETILMDYIKSKIFKKTT